MLCESVRLNLKLNVGLKVTVIEKYFTQEEQATFPINSRSKHS